MDVAYRIDPDGKLQARNQIILNQLTFGDKIDSPDATKLPVLLAVALLKDRNGVIDLDLPISGSINDPQFSIGGLIVKVIVNLLVKAITAPFALLTGGGGPDLSQVAFLPGTATLAPGAEAALDKVAKALQDRPGLRMTVTGTADLAAEHEGLQAAWVQQRVLAEQRRLALREGAAPDALLPALDAATRETLLKQVYADTKLPDKPRNVLGLAKDIPVAQMEALLRKAAPVNDDTARQLALDRHCGAGCPAGPRPAQRAPVPGGTQVARRQRCERGGNRRAGAGLPDLAAQCPAESGHPLSLPTTCRSRNLPWTAPATPSPWPEAASGAWRRSTSRCAASLPCCPAMPMASWRPQLRAGLHRTHRACGGGADPLRPGPGQPAGVAGGLLPDPRPHHAEPAGQ
jgi:hypothetical protein